MSSNEPVTSHPFFTDSRYRKVTGSNPVEILTFSGLLDLFLLLPTTDPTDEPSVFLPLTLRLEELSKLSIKSKAADKESWVPLRTSSELLEVWLALTSLNYHGDVEVSIPFK